jgi:hypothetical protein
MASVPQYSKLYWGPLIWKLFHTLAEASDRRDVLGFWRSILTSTALTMPCAQCRIHFSQYLREHPMTTVKRSLLITGPQTKGKLRTELWLFHNVVNKSIGLEEKPISILDEAYGDKVRGQLLSDAESLMSDIVAAWTPLVHTSVNGVAFQEWKKSLTMLIAILKGGPN